VDNSLSERTRLVLRGGNGKPQALHPVSHAPASAISRELSFFKTAACLIDILPDRA